MITKENLKDVVNSLSDEEKKRVLNSDKEYTVLYLHSFNTGYCATIRLTNGYNGYKNVSNNGDAILYTEEVQDIIKDIS